MSTGPHRTLHGGAGVALLMVMALVAGGCGTSSSSASAPPTSGGGLPESGEVVFFGISQQNPYVAQWHEGAQAQAEEYGWTLRYVESQNSQQEQDGQSRSCSARRTSRSA